VTMDANRSIESLLNVNMNIVKSIARIEKCPHNVVIVHFTDIPTQATLESIFDCSKKAIALPSSASMECKVRELGGSDTYESVFDDYYDIFRAPASCGISPEDRFELFALTNYTSFLGNHTALKTLTRMIGNAIKDCKTPAAARLLCGLEDDFTEDERKELGAIIKSMG